jgi:hypothetical protein
MSFSEKFWIRYYQIRPYVVQALMLVGWCLAATPMVLGSALAFQVIRGWGWPSYVLGGILYFLGIGLLAPVDTWYRKKRHEWHYRNWQGDPPEWRP